MKGRPRGAPSSSSAPSRQRPALVLGYFAIGAAPRYPGLAQLVEAIKRAQVPSGTTIYAGTYGVNRATADAIASLPGGVYAPLFSIQPTTSRREYAGRRLRKVELQLVDPAYAGAVRFPGRDPFGWGRELGARFRDALRRAHVETWQFDEIVSQVVGGRRADAYRLFTSGILDGLRLGRPELGDQPRRGIVWAARATLEPLPRLPAPTHSPLARLWATANHGARLYVGEEYVDFDGEPAAAAQASTAGQRALLAGGPARRALGRKYVVGMTPGFHPDHASLGGNVHGWSDARVNAWRRRFVGARRGAVPVAGFAQFNFTRANGEPARMRAAIRAAARAS